MPIKHYQSFHTTMFFLNTDYEICDECESIFGFHTTMFFLNAEFKGRYEKIKGFHTTMFFLNDQNWNKLQFLKNSSLHTTMFFLNNTLLISKSLHIFLMSSIKRAKYISGNDFFELLLSINFIRSPSFLVVVD